MNTLTNKHPEAADVSDEQILAIHRAIHSPTATQVLFREGGLLKTLPITIAGNKCRQIEYKNITFMEQNKSKSSPSAQLAREGHKITWGMRYPGRWIEVVDGIIKQH